MKGKTHDLTHDLTFYAHTMKCVCHSIRSMFRVLGVYNFDLGCKEFEILLSYVLSPCIHTCTVSNGKKGFDLIAALLLCLKFAYLHTML